MFASFAPGKASTGPLIERAFADRCYSGWNAENSTALTNICLFSKELSFFNNERMRLPTAKVEVRLNVALELESAHEPLSLSYLGRVAVFQTSRFCCTASLNSEDNRCQAERGDYWGFVRYVSLKLALNWFTIRNHGQSSRRVTGPPHFTFGKVWC